MNILYLTHLYPTPNEPNSGVFNYQRVSALKKAGYDIKVVVPVSVTPPVQFIFPSFRIKKTAEFIRKVWFTGNKLQGFEEASYIKWIALPRKFLWSYQHAAMHYCIGKEISKIINDFNPEIVITSVLHPEGSFAKYLKKKFNLPVISIAEGSEILLYPGLYKGINRIIKTINSYCAKIVFVSQNMDEIISQKYNIPNSCVINNGYDKGMFYFVSQSGNDEKPYRILSVGSLDSIKGHDLILEAVRNIPDIFLTIVGTGELLAEYNRFIVENNLTGRIAIKELIDPENMREVYQSNDIFCMASRSEGFGIAVLEALACGLPVVAANKGIVPEVIKEGINGYIINGITAKCVKDGIVKAIDTKWDKKKISESVINYSWDKWAYEMNDLIKRTLKYY
jgi:teichuronic acid biosynthesis glycosyltransferase TuaC